MTEPDTRASGNQSMLSTAQLLTLEDGEGGRIFRRSLFSFICVLEKDMGSPGVQEAVSHLTWGLCKSNINS